MSAVWILLYLGGLVHHLALYGYSPAQGGGALLLLPVMGLALLPAAIRRFPALRHPLLVRTMGLAGFACALLFVRTVYLDAWDTWRWGLDLLAAGAGLGSLWAMVPARMLPGPGVWLWVACWSLAGFLDPALPFLGAGLAGVLCSSGAWPGEANEERSPAPKLRHPIWAFLLLGLALPKPWWDFGLDPSWALASAAVGGGAALAAFGPAAKRLEQLPEGLILGLLGILAVLYWPPFSIAWGLFIGLAAGQSWRRLAPESRWTLPGLAFLGGLLISFTLHSNLGIPWLRHLIWLGN